jgi:biopolymer transport protein ExbB/TolQ
MDISPSLIPVAIVITGCAMVVGIVAIVFWNKTRSRELELHREIRMREMEHERYMKEKELEIQRLRSST